MSDVDDRIMVRRILAKFDDDALFQADVDRWLTEKLEGQYECECDKLVESAVNSATCNLSHEILSDVRDARKRAREKAVK